MQYLFENCLCCFFLFISFPRKKKRLKTYTFDNPILSVTFRNMGRAKKKKNEIENVFGIHSGTVSLK